MLNRANIQWSGKTLYNQVERGNVLFDCSVQRSLVWKIDKKRELIDSMLKNYPIPPFYFQKHENGKYDALDGKQRSNAIHGYIAGEYELQNLDPVIDDSGEEFDVNGLTFENLPEWAQDRIKEFSLTIYYFDSITEDEVAELFYRINNGKPLSSIELTRVKAKSLVAFQRLANANCIAESITDNGKLRYNDENTAMQAYTICYQDQPDFSTKPFREFIESAEVTEEQEKRLLSAMDYVHYAMVTLNTEDKEQARTFRHMKSRTHLVSCIWLAFQTMESMTKDEYSDMVHNFFGTTTTASMDNEYNIACKAGSARKEAISRRLNALRKLY